MVDIILPPKKNIILDATMLSSFAGCARLADFRFNRNLVQIGGKSNAMETGSLVHTNLEFFGHNKMNGFNRAQSMAAGFAAMEEYYYGCKECKLNDAKLPPIQGCERHKDSYLGCQNTPLENEKYTIGYQWVVETMQQYYDHYKNDSWTIKGVEQVVKKILYEDDEIRILWKAKIDWLLDQNNSLGLISMDHKTMKQNRESVTNNHQFMGQCLVTDQREMIIDKIGFQTSLEPSEKFKRQPQGYSADRLLEWQSFVLPQWVYKFLGCEETGVWEPNFNQCETKYGFCNFYKEICSVDRNMREENLRLYFKEGRPWDPQSSEI